MHESREEDPAHGPVESLDSHVSPEWWKHLFDETYLLTDGDVLDPEITEREIDRIVEQASLARSERILDLCCGQGRHSIELFRRGFERIQGLDQSDSLIEVARRAAADVGVDIPFRTGDARSLPYDDGSFDVVLILGNSLGYFDAEQEDRAVLDEVRRVLVRGGRLVVDLTDGDHTRQHYDPRSWEWASEDYLVCRERELADDGQRLAAREIIIHVDRGIEEDQFYAERLYGRREIRQLLQQTGFAAPRFTPIRVESTRGEDLGMMGHRLLITTETSNGLRSRAGSDTLAAGKPRGPNSHENRRPGEEVRYVAVVLGDPRRPDETKMGGYFDEDDEDVVASLREALGSLEGYEFIYFDDHDCLLDDLKTYGEAIDLVFNLCDEGLRNDPRKELHVPALLDALEIPYTGAGPQCLAQCYDKSMIRGVAREMGIPVAGGYFLRPETAVPDTLSLSFPVIVKPNAADNSAGMTTDCIAKTSGELKAAVKSVREHVGADRPLLIEQFLPGADLTYGVIGNPSTGLCPLPISEDNYDRLPDDLPRFCGYEAKWVPESPYWTDVEAVPADLPSIVRTEIQDDSHLLFDRLGCRDYARFDWRLDEKGAPHLLEVNPNPGWSWDSHLVEAAAFDDASYGDVLAAMLEAAFQRLSGTVKADVPHSDGQSQA